MSPPVLTWTCVSIMPGSTVAELRSITLASAGICTDAPTSAMRSPLMRTIWLFNIVPDFASKSLAARIATTCVGDARNFRSCARTDRPAIASTKTATDFIRQRMETSI